MKTKTDFYKDWAENHDLQTGKISLFYILVLNCLTFCR